MGFLSQNIWGFIVLSIGVGIAIYILATLGGTLTGTASTAINSSTSAINTNLVGNYGIILIVMVFVFVLALVKLLGMGSGGI